MLTSSAGSGRPTTLSHEVGIRKWTSVPSSSMSLTRFSAWSSCTPGRGILLPIQRVARLLLAEHPAVVFGADAVIMGSADTGDRTLPDRQAVRLELGEARPKARI